MTLNPLDHLLCLVTTETSRKLKSEWGIASFGGNYTTFHYYYSKKYTILTTLCTRETLNANGRIVKSNENRLFVCQDDLCIPASIIQSQVSQIYDRVIIPEWVLICDIQKQSLLMMEVFDLSPFAGYSSDLLTIEKRIAKTLKTAENEDTPPIYKCRSVQHSGDIFELHSPDMNSLIKRRRRNTPYYCVFGRITCVSSISIQQDATCTHYFIEVEHHDTKRGEQTLVNVMMIGSLSTHLHICMTPGRFIFLSEAVKVYSQECKTFLMQSKNQVSDWSKRQNRILLWDQPSQILTNFLPWKIQVTTKNVLTGSESCKSWETGSLLTYEGQVTDLRWEKCLQLDSTCTSASGSSRFCVWLLLYHYPNINELSRIRIGTRIRVYHAHLIDKSMLEGEIWAIGVCVRSHITVTKFASFEELDGTDSISLTKNEVLKPSISLPSEFGAIQYQPLLITFWLTSLFCSLSQQFNFGSDKYGHFRPMHHFPMLKRRQLTMRIVQALSPHLSNHLKQNFRPCTLGTLFLNFDHERMPTQCSSIRIPHAIRVVVRQRCTTISQLVTIASEIMADNVDQISQHGSFDTHIKNCFIVGRLSGTISNGDLILSDRTSKIAVTLSGAIDTPEEEQLAWAKLSQSCKPTDEVYIIKNVRVRACHYVGFTKPLLKEMSWAYSLLTALKDMVPVNVSVAEQHQTSSNALADRESDVLMFVTSFYPITTTRSLCSRGICDYQLVRGLITHSSENTNTLRFTQVLMPALCVPWLIKTGENYKITKLRKQVDATSDLTAIGHERMHVASLQPSDTRLIDSIRRFHKVMVEEFGYHEERLAKESVAFLSSFIGQFDAPCEQKYDTLYAHSDSTTNLFVSDCELQQYNILSSKKLAKLGISKWLQNLSSTPCKWKKWKHMTGRIYFLLHILPAMFLDSLSVGSPRDLSQFRRKQSSEQEGKDLILLEPALHQTHLRSVVGQIKSIRVSKRLNLRPVMTTDTTEVRLTCDLQDFDSPETVEVHINLTKFGFHGAFRMGLNVIFMNLDTYIARSSYKVHLNWGQHSSIQQLGQSQKVFPTSEVKMKTSHLLQLYRHSHLIDRSWHRWVARVVHINYFVLKRRCRSCHAELLLEKVDNYDWQHQQNPRKSCELQNLYPFREHDQIIRENIIRDITYLHTCVRGLIDDGSAQVELFAENRTAWNLLRASETQRKYFENIMTHKMSNLGYFFSACVQPDIAPSHQLSLQSNSQDLCGGFRSGYYEKQLSNVIQLCVNHHRTPLIIIGQRFYSKKQQRKVDPNYYDDLSCTSSVSYGEFRVTTTTRPVIRVEAKRVDTLQLKEEIRRLVATSEEFDGSM